MIKEIEQEIEIGDFFKLLNIKNPGEYKAPESLQIETPFGWKKVEGLLKTQKNPEWEVETENNTKATFTDYHRLETKDGKKDFNNNLNWFFVKDLKKGDEVKTINGWEKIKNVYFNNKYSEMYDLQVEDVRCYYTNGFNSHNTLFMGAMALNAFLDGKNVLVYTFETSEERLLMRYFSNLTELSKKEILSSEETLRERIKNLPLKSDIGRLVIKEFNANEVSSNDLLAHISDLEMHEKFKPDVIFVDYILIMSTNDKNLSSDNSYKYYKTVTEELRNIAKTLYVPVVTACQINREGMADRGGSKPNVTSKSVSESRGINDTVDVFWTIIQTQNEITNNKFRVLFDKNRNDRKGIKVEFEVDYEHMKIKELGTQGE